MSEENKAVVRRFLDALWNQHNLAIFDELTLYPRNPAARAMLTAFPDLHVTIDDQIAEGDKVVSRVTFHGTHQGEFAGVAPTYKSVRFTEIFIYRLEAGKLAERWSVYDRASLLHQIGAISHHLTHQGWVATLLA
jgi:predicted ester cyclase